MLNSNSVNVIFEADDNFCEVKEAPAVQDKTNFARDIECLKSRNLSDQQMKELKSLLGTFRIFLLELLNRSTLVSRRLNCHKI